MTGRFRKDYVYNILVPVRGGDIIHLTTSQSLFTVLDISQSLFLQWRGFGKDKVELTGKADMSRLEALAVGKACYARLYSYSRRNKK